MKSTETDWNQTKRIDPEQNEVQFTENAKPPKTTGRNWNQVKSNETNKNVLQQTEPSGSI